MNRLAAYYCPLPPTREALRDRARDVLDFCKVINLVHRQAGDRRESELEGLRELQLWATDTLRRSE